MRVIAGEARGRSLRAPRGMQTRPTSDLLRGVIFSMLEAMGCAPETVLDLYAGSGALGIEALSRGARHADFVERIPAACAVIRTNLEHTGLADRSRIICTPVVRSLRRLREGYDLILADPPYGDQTLGQFLSMCAAASLWRKETILVYEHSRRDPPPERLGRLIFNRIRSHGSSSVSFYALPDAEV